MRIVYLLFLLLPLTASAHIFVGNAGDVVKVKEGFALVDLWNLGLHEGAYVGAAADPGLPELPRQSEFGAVYPADLLARKLTDLNGLSDGFGDFVLAAMKAMHWRFVKDGLPATELAAEGTTFKAAGRAGGVIILDLDLWDKLDEVNKTALILHEVISSLTLPVKAVGREGYVQPQRDVTELVGLLFLRSSYEVNSQVIERSLGSRLGILPGYGTQSLRRPAAFTVSVSRGAGKKMTVFRAPPAPGRGVGGAERVRAFVRETCEKIARMQKSWGEPAYVQGRVESNGLELSLDRYAIERDSGLDYQVNVRFKRLGYGTGVVDFIVEPGTDLCGERLFPLYSAYLGAQIWR